MGWSVIVTPQAQEDLREIVAFIARDDPDRARNFGNLLLDKALALETLPERGRVVPELGDAAVREVVHGSYRVIYEVIHDAEAVFVLRFWHGARGKPQVSTH